MRGEDLAGIAVFQNGGDELVCCVVAEGVGAELTRRSDATAPGPAPRGDLPIKIVAVLMTGDQACAAVRMGDAIETAEIVLPVVGEG